MDINILLILVTSIVIMLLFHFAIECFNERGYAKTFGKIAIVIYPKILKCFIVIGIGSWVIKIFPEKISLWIYNENSILDNERVKYVSFRLIFIHINYIKFYGQEQTQT